MLKHLKIKFVASTMLILIVFFVVIIIAINYITFKLTEQQNIVLMTTIAENDGNKPFSVDMRTYIPGFDNHDDDHDYMSSVLYFSVIIDKEYHIIDTVNYDSNAYTHDDVVYMCNIALNSGASYGTLGYNKYLIQEKSYGMIIVFMDDTVSETQRIRLLKSSLTIGVVSLLVLMVIAMLLAHWMIKPVAETMKRQEQFISDASHELKTPIAVISANAEVLEADIGENRWLSFIRSEADRMGNLVTSLLTLAKIDDESNHMIFARFDMTKAVLSIALPFESIAFEKRVQLVLNIPEGITVTGEVEHIKQVAAILIDNAVKHTPDGGNVVVNLKKNGDKTLLEVLNTGEGIAPEDIDKIFERFYRSDKARDRTSNSFGLGLAIAKSIVDTHKGKIEVQSALNGWTRFAVTLKA